jgi:hypothetical protein
LKIWWLIIQIPPFSRKWPILPGKYMQVLSISHKMVDYFALLWIHRMTSLVSCCARIVNQNKWPTLLHDRADVTVGYIYFCYKITFPRGINNSNYIFAIFPPVSSKWHETNDVILCIHSVHKHRGNTFQRQNYKMRLKQRSLNWINSMRVKKILFTNVFFSWSLCL